MSDAAIAQPPGTGNPTLAIVNPATESVIQTVDGDAPSRIREKLSSARAAQPAWASQPLAERRAAIARWGELLVRDRERLATTLSREMGKPVRQSRNELTAMAGRVQFFVENVGRATAG